MTVDEVWRVLADNIGKPVDVETPKVSLRGWWVKAMEIGDLYRTPADDIGTIGSTVRLCGNVGYEDVVIPMADITSVEPHR